MNDLTVQEYNQIEQDSGLKLSESSTPDLLIAIFKNCNTAELKQKRLIEKEKLANELKIHNAKPISNVQVVSPDEALDQNLSSWLKVNE